MIEKIMSSPIHVKSYGMVKNDEPTQTSQPISTPQNLVKASPLSFKANAMPVKMSGVPYKQNFVMPQDNKTGFASFDEVIKEYEPAMKNVIGNFNERVGQDKQFLNWIDLPAAQMKKNDEGVSHVDEIYCMADLLKCCTPDYKPLVVLGIGGSKHTAEFLLNLSGVPKGKVLFYSDIDPISYENLKEEIGGDVRNANYLVVSKSGTTFETKDAYTRILNEITEANKKDGMTDEEALSDAETYFAICTDKTATDKNLRGQIGDKNFEDNNYIKELYIHDDVGGRYSMFDDPGIFALAYAGVPKHFTERILKSAAKTSEKSTQTDNIANNEAAKGAIFNVFSRDNGYKTTVQQFFGKMFESGGENWSKQLYLESLKDFDFAAGKAPDSMHYATEGQFNPNNRDKYNTIMTIMNQNISQNYQKYTDAISATYSETTPTKVEIIDTLNKGATPEAIGEYVQNKMFETVYMGMLRREVDEKGSNEKIDQLPEILQPSVETYKNKFKPGSPFELNPGSDE